MPSVECLVGRVHVLNTLPYQAPATASCAKRPWMISRSMFLVSSARDLHLFPRQLNLSLNSQLERAHRYTISRQPRDQRPGQGGG